ncbi:MAG: S8 family serine peptidase [Saprospiraceae bacterium]|jgi:serine protease|nr:S8 family serine peptidase [Saprospiraceae bacterium]
MSQSRFRFLFSLILLTSFNFTFSQNQQKFSNDELILKLKAGVDIHLFLEKIRSNTFIPSQFYLKRSPVPEWNIHTLGLSNLANPGNVIRFLSQMNEVEVVQRNHILSARLKPDDPLYSNQWFLNNDGTQGGVNDADIDADKAWNISTGGMTESGDTIVVCVIDDGVDIRHDDLRENLWFNFAEIPKNGLDDDSNGYVDDYRGWSTYTRNDSFGTGQHGTPVCGLAAAKGNNGIGISSPSWNIKLMFVEGGGDEANAIESYAYPWRMRKMYNESGGKQGAYVVATNTSWGADNSFPEDAPIWCAIYDSLGQVGILNAASTTNQDLNVDLEGDLPTLCPSDYLVTVTNINWLNHKDPSSGYGKKSIDIGVYGENLLTTYRSNNYRSFSGTSASAPLLTGAIGLLYSIPCNGLSDISKIDPPAAARRLKQMLIDGVKPLEELKSITVSGGVLNLYNSALLALPIIESSPDTSRLVFDITANNIILPIQWEYRVAGSNNWQSRTLYNTDPIELTGLKACTDYEVRFRGICDRYQNDYTPTRTFTTAGCCVAPLFLGLDSIYPTEAHIKLKTEPDFKHIFYILQVVGSTVKDTLEANITGDLLIIKGLEPCNQYTISLQSDCFSGKTSGYGEEINISTNGCEDCTGLDYCDRIKSKSSLEWLDALQIGVKKFYSGNNLGYGNFIGSSATWTLTKGQGYDIIFSPGFSSDSSEMNYSAWIDFNHDAVFDSTENVVNPDSISNTEFSQYFTVPQSSMTGVTRMRVVSKYASFQQGHPNPCNQLLEFGEYEDYCIYIDETRCEKIRDVSTASVGDHFIEWRINAALPVKYLFHEKGKAEFTEGFIQSNIFKIENLHECTEYILETKPECQLAPGWIREKAKTTGQNCITSTKNTESSDEIKVYPSASDGRFEVIVPESESCSEFLLFNIEGKAIEGVNQKLKDSNEFFINGPSGPYLLGIKTKSKAWIYKLLIKI